MLASASVAGAQTSAVIVFKGAQLIDGKLQMLAERDSPPDYVLIALSDDIIARCRTAEYTTQEEGRVHRDLRRALKALAMRYRIPTQLLRETTSGGRDETPPSRIAWNFFTGMYWSL